MKIFILFLSVVLISSCSQQVVPNKTSLHDLKTTNILKQLYTENTYIAGFKNNMSDQVDSFDTFRGVKVNDFFERTVNIDTSKLEYFTLSKLNDMRYGKNLSRDLNEEKDTIQLLSYLNIKIDNNFKNKIVHSLNKQILLEDKNNQEKTQELTNINHQFKVQIYYNYLYILKYLHQQPSEKIKTIIDNNLNDVENNLSEIEKNSIKAIYYLYQTRIILGVNLSSNEKREIIKQLQNLHVDSYEYSYIPKKIYQNQKVSSDLTSSRMAIELLQDLNFPLEKANNINIKLSLSKQFKKNVLIENDPSASLINLHEFVLLCNLVNITNFKQIDRM